MAEFESVNKLLEKGIRENWERPGLSNYQGVTYLYKDIALLIKKIHLNFGTIGLKEGDKVAICAKNQVNWGVSFLAALTYGAVPVPLLHEFKAENIHYLVTHSEARVLFVDEAIWEGLSVTEMPQVEVVVRVNDFHPLYVAGNLLALQAIPEITFDNFSPEDICYHEDSAEELAVINYTSGTSGFSKGVMLPYRAIFCNMWFAGHVAEPQLCNTSKLLSLLPSAHMYGMMFEFLFQMTIGTHVYFLNKVPSPKIILQAFADIHPDLIIAVPLIIEKVYRSQIKPLADKNSFLMNVPFIGTYIRNKFRSSVVNAFGGKFEEIILGGAAFNPEVEAFFKKIRFPFTVGYGMTECCPIITYAHWDKTKKGACGVPVPGCEIRIESRNPYREPGEIQVHGQNVFIGYYKNRKATKESFTNDGWFKTGDMGVIDRDGYLYLKGRLKCMILGPSGQNIYPEEIEAVINNANYVIDSLVVPGKSGLIALVYPDWHQADSEGISRDDLETMFNEKLPELNRSLPLYAQIHKIELMQEDFERTPKRSIKRYLYTRDE